MVVLVVRWSNQRVCQHNLRTTGERLPHKCAIQARNPARTLGVAPNCRRTVHLSQNPVTWFYAPRETPPTKRLRPGLRVPASFLQPLTNQCLASRPVVHVLPRASRPGQQWLLSKMACEHPPMVQYGLIDEQSSLGFTPTGVPRSRLMDRALWICRGEA